MKGLRFGCFDGLSRRNIWKIGMDFTGAVTKAGADFVMSIPYKDTFENNGILYLEHEIEKAILENSLNVITYWVDDCLEFSPEFFARLRQHCFMILFAPDDEHSFERAGRYYAQAFDLVLVPSPLNVGLYQLYNIPVRFFPSCFNLDEYRHIENISAPDVVFVGVVAGKIGRQGYIDKLKESGINVRLFGLNTPGGIISRQHMNALFKSAKISLNFTGIRDFNYLDFDLSVNRRMKQVKGRCQEIALTGGFALSEHAPGIERLFEPGKEFDIFNTPDELVEKVAYYLEHDEERKAIAERGHKRAWREYDEVYQWTEIGKYIQEHKDDPRTLNDTPLHIDSVFRRHHAAFHLSTLLPALVRGKFRFIKGEMKTILSSSFPHRGAFLQYSRFHIYLYLGYPRRLFKLLNYLHYLFRFCFSYFRKGVNLTEG